MRKIRKKFKRPKVSWDSDSIKENKAIAAEYGLRRRKEILISHEILRGFRQRARQLIAEKDEEKEKVLMKKLARIGLLVGSGKELDDVLALTVRNVLDRRLQTVVFRKGVATSLLNARQMIVHGHVKIGGRKVNIPSYLVPVEEEKMIEIAGTKPKPKKPTARPAEAKAPEGGKADESKPADGKAADSKPAEEKPAEGKAGNDDAKADDKKGDG
jgi:small subunit ribosomal protein S4